MASLDALSDQKTELEAENEELREEVKGTAALKARLRVEEQVRRGKEEDVKRLLRVRGLPSSSSSSLAGSESSH